MKSLLSAAMPAIASVAQAAPLTVRAGENWVFKVKDGQPADAHKVEATVKPAKGEVMVTVRSLFGTVLITSNNSSVAYRSTPSYFPARI